MHIAIVTRNLGSGGAERVIAQLIRRWTLEGNRCSLICMNPVERFYELPESTACYDIPSFSDQKDWDKICKYAHLRKVVKELQPDVVLSLPEEIGVYVIPALLGTGIPVVVSERNNPWVMPNKKITRLLRQAVYPVADGLIFQTEQAASFFPKYQQARGTVLPNPLDLSRLPEVNLGQREKTVISGGRLEPQKNFSLLIEAFAKFHEDHPDYSLVIYGEGREREKLEALAAEKLPQGSWSLPGKVSDLPDRVAKGGIFALSSDYEGVPNVLIEAMACGTACVSTDCAPGGAASLIDDGENGILVPVGDAEGLARGMSRLADEPQTAAAMGEKAVKIREKLDAEQVAGRWLDYLKAVKAKKERSQEGLTLSLKGRSLSVSYQHMLVAMFVILTTLSGWAMASSSSTMTSPLTLALNRYASYGCLLGILGMLLLKPKQFDLGNRWLMFTPVIYWCMYYILRFNRSLPINITGIVIMCLFCLLSGENKRLVYEWYRRVLVALCGAGVVFYLLYLLGLESLFTRYEYYTPSIGGEYVSYLVGSIHEKGSQLRLCGHFNEPGFLGTIVGLVLCAENLNFKKVGNVVLLAAGCLTFSLAYYVILAAYVALKCIPLLVKKPVLLIPLLIALALYLFVFPHIRTGNARIDQMLQRLVLSKENLERNSRSNWVLDNKVFEVMKTRDFLIGKGAGYFASLKSGTVSSFKTYIVDYGIVGVGLIFGSLLYHGARLCRRNFKAVSLVLVFALSIYQRPNVMILAYFVILFGGVGHILHREGRKAEKA